MADSHVPSTRHFYYLDTSCACPTPAIRRFLRGYIDGNLSPSETEEVADHIGSCLACVTYIANVKTIMAASEYYGVPADESLTPYLTLVPITTSSFNPRDRNWKKPLDFTSTEPKKVH